MTDEQNREQLSKEEEEQRLEDLQKLREEIEIKARGPSGKYRISDDPKMLSMLLNSPFY